ncbi:putative RNA polymerase subunit delta [Trichinella spiralis]|uniref:putative RNA polymerase subunit delta n=1 Tax=Trichinella spiralis TaxID=6334 RepID=UPI0001EFD765|nr:putative RNA polymerase subunit delta [Trichinella spiralis]
MVFRKSPMQFKEWSKEKVKTRTTRSRTREGNRVVSDTNAWHSLDKRFAVLEYANEDRLKIPLSTISNGAHIKPMEKRRNEKSDDTKQIKKRNKVPCASAFCKSGVGIL